MAKLAKLSYDGKSVEFPLVEGTENELGIDIKTLRAATNLITLDPGFKNTCLLYTSPSPRDNR